jgi:hypothetical protein
MNKEEFFKIITQQPRWEVCDLICILGMTEDELADTIVEYTNELEVHVEGEYTLSGVLRTKTISFAIREQERNPLDILYGISNDLK